MAAAVENNMEIPQKMKNPIFLKVSLPYDIIMSLLGIHPNELKTGSQRDVCTLKFTAALFTLAKK